MKYVRLVCGECGKEFDKNKSTISKSKNVYYCGKSCSAKAHNKKQGYPKYLTLICSACGVSFQRREREYRKQLKKNKTETFCSRKCSNQEKFAWNDGLATFRWYTNVAYSRRRSTGKEVDITPEYLKEIWDSQNGRCPITNWELQVPIGLNKWDKNARYKVNNASMDRIDNKKGYVIGNVRFVALIVNLARNIFTDEEVIEFAKAVVEHQEKLRKAA
jgi:hypothetical protein